MPLYDFSCRKCNNKFEEYKKLNEEAEIKCPFCGSFEVKQMMGPIAIKIDLQPYFDMGIGQMVRNRQHRNQLMKEKGLTEIGNERPDPAKEERARERQQEKEYEQLKGEAYKFLSGDPAWN